MATASRRGMPILPSCSCTLTLALVAGGAGAQVTALPGVSAVRRHLEARSFDPTNPRGPYLGQRPPGTTPIIFGPGFISTASRSAGGIAFSPDANEIYFGGAGLCVTRQVGSEWTTPALAPFRGAESSFEPGMTPDGQRLYFASTMDRDKNGSQIWYVNRSGSNWSAPVNLGPGAPTGFKMAPTATANGNLYFTAGQGQMGWFYTARWTGGGFETAVQLPSVINAFSRMDHSFIAPDESYLVFTALTGVGQHLFVSFKARDGSWLTPVELGANVNSTISQIGPAISPDGRYLFFTRFDGYHGDIWWVDARVVFDLKPPTPGGG